MSDVTGDAVRYQAMFARSFEAVQAALITRPHSPRESYHALRETYAAGAISLEVFEEQVAVLLRNGL